MPRPLIADEIRALEANGNVASDWGGVFVSDPFCPDALRHNRFDGKVVIGVFDSSITHSSLALPEGITHSWLRDCAIADHCAIHQVRLLSGCGVGAGATLFDIGELSASSDAPFPTAEVMNENGRRAVRLFPGMTVADAYLWAKYRGRNRLMQRLDEFASATPQHRYVGAAAQIMHCQCLRNSWVVSSAEAPTVIDGATAIDSSVIGLGCHVERGPVLRNTLLGENVHIEDCARINDSVVGDNSTIARCEVGNSIIFPAHEQHHNNSFLIAACVMGQSNLAAGATIGSNHNGRTADGELRAGRGFWPGLCSSFKHPSYFASYCLAAKGDYPNELNITLPFALINNNAAKNQLEVMPAYWWLYNMYALHRNEKKFANRDRRCVAAQHIEFSPLAPDTAEEIMCARELLRHWTEQAYIANVSNRDAAHIEVTANAMEHGKRKVVVLKAAKAYQAYEDMLYYYIGSVLAAESRDLPSDTLAGTREMVWANLGGQLVAQTDLDAMIKEIEQGSVASWQEVNERLDSLWSDYHARKREHAYRLLCRLGGTKTVTPELWQRALARYDAACRYVAEQVSATRGKDDANPFRRMMYDSDAEMTAVLG